MPGPTIQFHTFTGTYDARSLVLVSSVDIFESFDPQTIPLHLQPTPRKYPAIWDTGATGTVISEKVINECGLHLIDFARVHSVDGISTSPVYLINIRLPNGVGITNVRATRGDLPGSDAEVLIGMNIIGLGDFAISAPGGKTMFSFRFPASGEPIDFCVQPPSGGVIVDQTGPVMLTKPPPVITPKKKTASVTKQRSQKRKKKPKKKGR